MADEVLGLVYVPTGNTPPDFFGGVRTPEQDRYPSSIAAPAGALTGVVEKPVPQRAAKGERLSPTQPY